MAAPHMFIAAGPPGGGKSPLFVLSRFAEHTFNADDRAAELNGGSYENISTSVRAVLNREFEEFVRTNIRAGTSFALETTLRSTITFEQARLAKQNGFRVSMFYIALDSVERHIERVIRRAARGGHSASERTLRRIYASSLANLPTALNPDRSGIDVIQIYDNSRSESRPILLMKARHGRIAWLSGSVPDWLRQALGWTQADLNIRRRELMR